MNTFPLENKICLITGGLGGIALGVSKLILKRGGKVFLCDLKSESEGEEAVKKELQQNPENSGYAKCDVTIREDIEGNHRNTHFTLMAILLFKKYLDQVLSFISIIWVY